MRQKDQTTKKATGGFDRDRLLNYLEKEAMEHKDREDIVPFTGERKGRSASLFLAIVRRAFTLFLPPNTPSLLAGTASSI